MISPFDEVLRNLQNSKPKETIENVIHLNTGNILRMVKNRLRYGQSINGGIIGRYRSIEYALDKNRQNPLAGLGNVDLFLTGALQDDLTITKENNLFKIYSTDEKYTELANKYGADQFGLTNEQLNEFLIEVYIVSLETIINKIYGK